MTVPRAPRMIKAKKMSKAPAAMRGVKKMIAANPKATPKGAAIRKATINFRGMRSLCESNSSHSTPVKNA